VVERWTEARNDGRVDDAMAVLANQGVVLDLRLADADERAQLRGVLEAQRIAEWRIEESSCRVEGERVTCQYAMDDRLLRKCSLRFTGTHTYVVDDGRIMSASRVHDPESRAALYGELGHFRDWVTRNHPDAAAIIWIDPQSATYTTVDGAQAVVDLADDYPCGG
jgi:hypothetical protein